MNNYLYQIADNLYVNLTNKCTAQCVFCRLTDNRPLHVCGYDLTLEKEPSEEELLTELKNWNKEYKEMVFCGFGEPTLRLENFKTAARYGKSIQKRVRLNTNGHGNLIHKRNIVPELEGLIDEVRVSLNAATPQNYLKIVNPLLPGNVYDSVKIFIRECKKYIPKVVASAVALPGLDLAPIYYAAALELSLPLMIRKLDCEGEPQPVIPAWKEPASLFKM